MQHGISGRSGRNLRGADRAIKGLISIKRKDGPGLVTWGGILLVAAAAAILTFTTLRDLATACGIGGEVLGLPLAWLLPITVDASGAVAIRVWLTRTAPDEATSLARRLSWVCITLSIAGNAGQHGMAAYGVVPPWPVIVLVSAVPPAMFGAIVHLAVLMSRPQSAFIWNGVPEKEDEPELTQKPTPSPEPPEDEPEDDSKPDEEPSPGDQAKLDQLRAWMSDNGDAVPSKRKVITMCGVGHAKAGKLIEALQS
jgi:Protein of unknown function (DUF2637)